jgi:uncharacterized protein (TIGR02271 family)
LTAFFDERDDAEEAVSRLRTLGIADSSLRLTGGGSYGETADPYDEKGFWDSVADFFFPEEDRATYAEGLRRGGYLVTVNGIRADQYDQALDILDDEGSVDLDARAETWRSEGWTGSAAGAGRQYDSGGSLVGGTRDDAYSSASETYSGARSDEEVIPVVEERLRVGKRDVDQGRVRVRSYVVEEPISEDVNLRQDRVEIERRPVDRPLAGDERAFRDRTIEAEEHAEEAVVSKDARVKEEIALRRKSSERTETVSDTVRHTEIEVEDDRDEDLGDAAKRY